VISNFEAAALISSHCGVALMSLVSVTIAIFRALGTISRVPYVQGLPAKQLELAIADQDHGGVAMTVPASLPGSGHQALDLGLGQIFAGTVTASVPNWGKNSGWREAADR
jgi:hypothetical protein